MLRWIVCLGWITWGFSQVLCGTPDSPDSLLEQYPWFGNNAFLIHYADSLGLFSNPPPSKTAQKPYEVRNVLYNVPLYFWNVDEVLPDEKQLWKAIQENLDSTNRSLYYAQAPFQFYSYCTWGQITNSKSVWDPISGCLKLKPSAIPGFVNVYLVDAISDAYGVYSPCINPPPMPIILIERKHFFDSVGTRTLLHEIGHYFCLQHTYRNADKGKCKQEPVNRNRIFQLDWCISPGLCFIPPISFYCLWLINNKLGRKGCEVNGDLFCDTPADYEDSYKLRDTMSCSYNGTKTDHWGDVYSPDLRNVMSANTYSTICDPYHLSPMQVTAMLYCMAASGSSNIYAQQFSTPDIHEPDDVYFIARNFVLDVPQHHTFHWSWNGYGWIPCDIDWVWFMTFGKEDKYLRIRTSKGHFNDADTYIALYQEVNNNLVPIASDDNSGQGNYSALVVETVPGGKYYLSVALLSPSFVLSDYILSVERCVPYLSACVPQSKIAATSALQSFYAWDYLSAPCTGETLKIPAGTSVLFQSEGAIDLLPGFEVEEGAEFTAEIAPITISACQSNKLLAERKANGVSSFPPVQATASKAPLAVPLHLAPFIRVYPNPFSSTLFVDFPFESTWKMTLYTITGKKVYESTCSACHRGVIEVEDLESGAYLLKVQNEKGVLYHKLLLHL